MSRFGSQYQVARNTGVCAASGVPLEPGAPCIASLCEREEDEGFDRLDYSIEAWDDGRRPERLFSFWRTTVAESNAKQRMFVDDEVLTDLFHRLAEDDRPQRQAFRFVLGLILMRKRLLKFIGREPATDDQPERWRLIAKGAGDDAPPIDMINPELDDEDVREITAQLSEVLQGDM
jgi:hypothetical protein